MAAPQLNENWCNDRYWGDSTHDDRTLASHPVPFFISAEESQSLDGTGGPRKRLRQSSERQVRGDTSIR